jgi:hypothetical protein
MRLPGVRPDSLPSTFLTGSRACAMLTSAERPKREEFTQYDRTPALLFNPQNEAPDSLSRQLHLTKPLQIFVQVLVSERGLPLLAEMPWVTEDRMPASLVHHVMADIASWRFLPAIKFSQPQRSWVSVEYIIKP